MLSDADIEAHRLKMQNISLCGALTRLVRKGTDGRWYTSQHGDADVTDLVGSVVARLLDSPENIQ